MILDQKFFQKFFGRVRNVQVFNLWLIVTNKFNNLFFVVGLERNFSGEELVGSDSNGPDIDPFIIDISAEGLWSPIVQGSSIGHHF